jgi:hypothetical protein
VNRTAHRPRSSVLRPFIKHLDMSGGLFYWSKAVTVSPAWKRLG